MFQNTFQKHIEVPVFKVWEALTNPETIAKWMKNTKVETNWEEGSSIVYTCFDDKGEIMKWEGVEMIWSGTIERLLPNQEITCVYPDSSTGLIKESYFLDIGETGSTYLRLVQELNSQEIADKYKEGCEEMLQMLKDFLEKKEV